MGLLDQPLAALDEIQPDRSGLVEFSTPYTTTAESLGPDISGLDYSSPNSQYPASLRQPDSAIEPSAVGAEVIPDEIFSNPEKPLHASRGVPSGSLDLQLRVTPLFAVEKKPAFVDNKPGPVEFIWQNIQPSGQEISFLVAQENTPNQNESIGDPELGIIRVRNPGEDPELGILRIQEQPVVPETPSQTTPRIGFFTARLAAASSDNILLAVNDVGGLTGDEFLRPGVSLAFYPPLGPQTFLIGNIDMGLQRYTTESDFNYDDLRFRIGVRQGLFPRTYGQLMFTYQQLFRPGPPRFRFFENAAFSFTLGRRDPLTDQLTLNSYYQIQLNDTESRPALGSPTDFDRFDRITQYLGGSLNYTINPKWRTGISYQVTFSDYTGQERYDTFHQLIGQLTYRITPDVRMSVYGGWSFGRSSEPRIRFDDTLFGITVDATVTLF
jgi:hypothetical protein